MNKLSIGTQPFKLNSRKNPDVSGPIIDKYKPIWCEVYQYEIVYLPNYDMDQPCVTYSNVVGQPFNHEYRIDPDELDKEALRKIEIGVKYDIIQLLYECTEPGGPDGFLFQRYVWADVDVFSGFSGRVQKGEQMRRKYLSNYDAPEPPTVAGIPIRKVKDLLELGVEF